MYPSDQSFMVAASRMGIIENPTWCFIDTPFYPLPGIDHGTVGLSTKSTTTSMIDIRVQYSNTMFQSSYDNANFFACETF